MDRITITDKDRAGFTIIPASENKPAKVSRNSLEEALLQAPIEWIE
jgi:hypothetical protein